MSIAARLETHHTSAPPLQVGKIGIMRSSIPRQRYTEKP